MSSLRTNLNFAYQTLEANYKRVVDFVLIENNDKIKSDQNLCVKIVETIFKTARRFSNNSIKFCIDSHQLSRLKIIFKYLNNQDLNNAHINSENKITAFFNIINNLLRSDIGT